jgi:hypothetical protein
VTMAVRLLASIPAVTCSAVEADPNPLGPALPVINEKIPITLNRTKNTSKVSKLILLSAVAPLFDHMSERETQAKNRERERETILFSLIKK